jgi:hypothetical protein
MKFRVRRTLGQCGCALGDGGLSLDEIFRMGVKLRVTGRRAEIISLSPVRAFPGGGILIHLHAADWIMNFFQSVTWDCATF